MHKEKHRGKNKGAEEETGGEGCSGGGDLLSNKLGLHPAWLKITWNYSAARECEITLIGFWSSPCVRLERPRPAPAHPLGSSAWPQSISQLIFLRINTYFTLHAGAPFKCKSGVNCTCWTECKQGGRVCANMEISRIYLLQKAARSFAFEREPGKHLQFVFFQPFDQTNL